MRKIILSNLLEKELNQPSDDFAKHFAKQVHTGAIRQTGIQEFRPLVKRAWDELVDQEIARRLRRHEEQAEDLSEPPPENGIVKATPPAADIIEIYIFASYKSHRSVATLLVDEIMNWHKKPVLVRYEGELMS